MILDTNVYSALALGVKSAVDVIDGVHEITLPLPVVAELRYGFLKGSQKNRNEQNLQKFIAQPHVDIAIPNLKTSDTYADLLFYATKRGKALSHNDIWIAAISYESSNKLVTFDQDFSIFLPLFDGRLILLDQ